MHGVGSSTVAGPPRRNTAIFIDMENLIGGYGGDGVAGVEISTLLDEITGAARRSGVLSEVAVVRAYANWSHPKMKVFRREMLERGVEPVQVFSFGHIVKNAADIELVVDALSLAGDNPAIDVFVIVSGDQGFVPLVRRLHALGRYVMVAATVGDGEDPKSKSKLLAAVADEFHICCNGDDPEAPERPAPASVAHTTHPGSGLPDTDELSAALRAFIDEDPTLVDVAASTLNSAMLGQHLRRRWPDFTPTAYGAKTLTKLASDLLGAELRAMGSLIGDDTTAGAAPPLSVVSDAEPADVAGYRRVLAEVVGDPTVTAHLQWWSQRGGLRLQQVTPMIAAAAPGLDWRRVGFPKLNVALRYALAGTAWCLSGSPADQLFLTARATAPAPIADLDDADLSSAEVLRDVLGTVDPPLRFMSAAALSAVAEFVTTEGPTAPLAELVESIADAYPDLDAAGIRVAVGLCETCGVLIADGTDDHVVSLAPDVGSEADVLDRVWENTRSALDEVGWPYTIESLEALVPRPGFLV